VILAIDQGTTGTTCLVVDDELGVRGRGYVEVEQFFPQPGWVEHDPEELWSSVLTAAEAALREAGIAASDLKAIGITNQRETTLVWERQTGRPIARAIVWQDRRTAERCRELPAELIRERTGLVPDPYFSATKLEWLLREHDPRDLAFGTVDTWLVWKLTGGRVHATDETNAGLQIHFVFKGTLSRTMPGGMSVLSAGPENVEVHCIGLAVFTGSNVFGEKNANSQIRCRLTRQKDFERREGILLRGLDVNSGCRVS
jgi:glycerol kinase